MTPGAPALRTVAQIKIGGHSSNNQVNDRKKETLVRLYVMSWRHRATPEDGTAWPSSISLRKSGFSLQGKNNICTICFRWKKFNYNWKFQKSIKISNFTKYQKILGLNNFWATEPIWAKYASLVFIKIPSPIRIVFRLLALLLNNQKTKL